MIELARRSVPDLRRNAETIEPVGRGRGLALLRQARERLDWRRKPGVVEAADEDEGYLHTRLVKGFLAFVLVPTAVIGLYLFAFASNQYIAEAQFAVRGNVEPMGEVMLGDYTSLIQKHNSQDSFIVRDFILSQTLVQGLEKDVGLSKLFSRPEADFWTRFRPPEPVEELTKYWRERVDARIDIVSGVIMLGVRAYTPEDALMLAREVVRRSESLINDISKRAQADMVTHAQSDVDKAGERLRTANLNLQRYRNRWGIIDPIKAAEATLAQIATLRKEKFKAENDLQVLRGSNLDEKSRAVQVLVASVAALDQQIKQLQDQLTSETATTADGRNMAEALLEYEGLVVERTIAEKLNESAITMLDRARVAASKQQIYLTTFVPPMLPDDSLYPRRGRALFTAFFAFFVVWSSFSLVASGIKDQRV
ncbi:MULTISPECIES: capsule biosynthesis protein [Methylobacterium]|nr:MULTISPECIES: capsule biosynthesis protein [Methylobacterium]